MDALCDFITTLDLQASCTEEAAIEALFSRDLVASPDPQATLTACTETAAMDAQCSRDRIFEIAQLPFDWRSVGSHLIGAHHVSIIDCELHCEQNRWEKMRMLSTWLQQKGSEATYRHLVEAVEKVENKSIVEKMIRLVMEGKKRWKVMKMVGLDERSYDGRVVNTISYLTVLNETWKDQ